MQFLEVFENKVLPVLEKGNGHYENMKEVSQLKITDSYNGDFNEIKNNLNVLIEAMERITVVAGEIAEGNLLVEVPERSGQDELMRTLSSMVKKLYSVANKEQFS